MCLLSEQCGWAFLASLCTDGSCDCAHWDASAGGWPSGLLHTPVWHLGVSSRVPCPCGISSSRTLPVLVLQEGTHDFYFLASRSTEVVAGRPCGLDGELSQCPFHHIYRLEQVTGPAQTGCARGPCRGTNAGRWSSLGFLSKDERCVLGAFSCSLHAIFVL